MAALVRVAAGLALGVVLGLVVAPLVVEAALDRIGDRGGVRCCAGPWAAPGSTPSLPDMHAAELRARAERAVLVVDRARRAFTDIDELLQVP